MHRRIQQIHFVGIGGIGMSGIAEVLLNLGYRVSGSDLRQTEITRRLAGLGAVISQGHHGEAVAGADVVVVSSAVRPDNPEVQAARAVHIPVIRRAEMLAELMRLKRCGIAIAGSHGKTTTTSLVAWILAEAGLDPTVIIGGKLNSLGTNAVLGQGDYLVAEADESDGSFLKLVPMVVAVTNVDREHLDHYPNLEAIKEAFIQFVNGIPFYGAAVLCLDDANTADLLPRAEKRVITYGTSAQAELHAAGIVAAGYGSTFEVWHREERLGQVALALPGRHNVLNALAAIAIGRELEIPFTTIAAALATFAGVQRRLQVKGETAGVLVVDDYGHHPTEIKATLAAVRLAWPGRRLVVLFQPHRYTRTAALFNEFANAFHEADQLVLTEIYPASEAPIPGVTAAGLAQAIHEHGHRSVAVQPDLGGLAAAVLPQLAAGDLVLTLGAGSIWRCGEELLALLATRDGGGTPC
ncbi:MAG: UDP-N-acetylmuramate--L-alanine ligase [Thermodesulfobacteriota bacterium]